MHSIVTDRRNTGLRLKTLTDGLKGGGDGCNTSTHSPWRKCRISWRRLAFSTIFASSTMMTYLHIWLLRKNMCRNHILTYLLQSRVLMQLIKGIRL
nr:PREDICTED: uncharacterized protein LOC109040480 isoform X2 [Bemisia tabaci]